MFLIKKNHVRFSIFQSFVGPLPMRFGNSILCRQVRNPVMFTVFVGSILTTFLGVQSLFTTTSESPAFILSVSAWLWFTVLFANFAEAMAEGRGNAGRCCGAMRKMCKPSCSISLRDRATHHPTPASLLRKDDVVLVEAGEFVPGDGEVIEGVASVDEIAITGETAARSFAKAAAIAAASRAAHACYPIGSGANYGESRRNVYGPHDFAGGSEMGKRRRMKIPLTFCLPR